VHAVVKHERLASRRLYVPQRDQPLSQALQALSRRGRTDGKGILQNKTASSIVRMNLHLIIALSYLNFIVH
jgi:hypothetical protein